MAQQGLGKVVLAVGSIVAAVVVARVLGKKPPVEPPGGPVLVALGDPDIS